LTVAKAVVLTAVVASVGVFVYRDVRNYLSETQRYRVAHIEVRGAHRLSKDEVIKCSGVHLGDRIFELGRSAAENNIANHHRIRDMTVHVTVPDRVSIEVVERVPVALVVSNRPYEIDADGVVLGEYEEGVSPEGPIISGIEASGPLKKGSRIETKELSLALELWRIFSSDPLSKELIVSEIDLSDSSALVMIFSNNSNKKYEIRWPRGDFVQSLHRLRTAWRESGGFPDTNRYIDLRFDNQIPTR
jgi:cell division septal protein FtsQ